jgi:LacI family transcriptional regulator
MYVKKCYTKRITIKDIALDLGMHHSTVSRALRSSSEINKETKNKVLKYAALKGYQVNRNAFHLRGTGSNIIGIIVPNIQHSFFSNFVSIVTRMAFDVGYIVAVFQSEESVEQEKEILNTLVFS